MAHYRIWRENEPGDIGDTVFNARDLDEHARRNGPGAYAVVESFRFEHPHLAARLESSREWGRVVHHSDGTIERKKIAWGD